MQSNIVDSFLKSKRIWEQLSFTEREQTLLAISEIWNAIEDPIDATTPDDILSLWSSKKILVRDQKGEWQFVLPQFSAFVQALNNIRSQQLHTLSSKEVLQRLLQTLQTTIPSPSHEPGDLVSFTIVLLVNEYGQTHLPSLFVENDIPQEDFWQIYNSLCKVLPILELDTTSFSSLFEIIAIRVQDDMMKFMIFTAAEQLGNLKPDIAFKLLDTFIESKNSVIGSLLYRIMIGIAKSTPINLDKILTTSEEWLRSTEQKLHQSAILCMLGLTLENNFEVDRLLTNIDSLNESQTKGVIHSIAIALAEIGARFKSHRSGCFERLKSLKQQFPIGEFYHGIAIGLSGENDIETLNFKFGCLSLLTDVPISDKVTIRQIASLLYPLHPQNVWQFLEDWIKKHELKESITADDMFLYVIREAHKRDPDLSRRVVTYWFSSSNLRLVGEGREIVQKLSLENFAPDITQNLSPEETVYIIEKLLVGPLGGLQLLKLLHSILLNAAESEYLANYFLGILEEIAWNIPGSTQKFLDQTLKEDDDSIVSQLLGSISEKLQKYKKQRKDVFVPELAPSRTRIRQYVEHHSKQMQKIQKAAFDEQGGLISLVHHVNIARGDRSFHMNILHPDPTQRRTFSIPSGFGHFEHSVELPRDELLDPEAAAWRRLRRINLTLEDIQIGIE